MFCKNCGSQMNDDATFCFNCGWSNTLIEEKNKQRNVNIQNKAFLILVIAVSIIAFILLAILNFRKDGWQGDYYYKNGEKLKNSWVGDYYVGEDGKYVKNAWAKYENDWYYCGSDGKIVKNNWVDNQNYYVDGSGKMLKNTMTPDGYYVGEDGKYNSINGRAKELIEWYINECESNPILYKKREDGSYEIFPGQTFNFKFDKEGNLWRREYNLADGGAGGDGGQNELVIKYINGGESRKYIEKIGYDVRSGEGYVTYPTKEDEKKFKTFKNMSDCFLQIKQKFGM